jgi:glycosyl transferase family 2
VSKWGGVTLIMPHIGTRKHEYVRALKSVAAQNHPPEVFIVRTDYEHIGAARMRNIMLEHVDTEWVAFVDDDDVLGATHLSTLTAATKTGADVYYPGYDVIGGHDIYQRFGLPFDADVLRDHSYIPVTSLIRTQLVLDVHGFGTVMGQPNHYEDWGLYLKLLNIGAKFEHVSVKTWEWYHWGEGRPGVPGNTSGLGTRW